MFKKHQTIFVTFDQRDRGRAVELVAQLRSRFTDKTFVGRHETSGDIPSAIALSTLTLVIESAATTMSTEVQSDLAASLAKSPPNVILRILLDEEMCDSGSAVGSLLVGAGAECVSTEIEEISGGIERCEELYKMLPKLTDAASAHQSTDPGSCGR